MEQLELRFYSREEIAEITSVNINDSGHFSRDVRRELSKWGYGYQYIRNKGVEITSKPETPEERLAEILIRAYNIDIQIDPVQFACFISAFTDIESFHCMPWGEREDVYHARYGFAPDDRTLRNWHSRLMRCGVISTFDYSTAWRTEVFRGSKIRTPITGDEEEELKMQEFFDRRKELVAQNYNNLLQYGLSPKDAKKMAWTQAYDTLWKEFHCCYYWCKSFTLSAFTPDDKDVLCEIHELVQEIVGTTIDEKRIRDANWSEYCKHNFVF